MRAARAAVGDERRGNGGGDQAFHRFVSFEWVSRTRRAGCAGRPAGSFGRCARARRAGRGRRRRSLRPPPRRRCGLADAAPRCARTPASHGVAADHRARQREGGGDADGAGHRMRGMAAARREVARRDAVGVVAVAGDHRLGHDAARTRRRGPSPRRRRSARPRCAPCSARSASSSAGVSRPLRPRSRARTITSGIAASMQVTCKPSITSMRLSGRETASR